MAKLQEINGSYFISLPKKLIERFGWKKGTNIDVLQTAAHEKKLLLEETQKPDKQ